MEGSLCRISWAETQDYSVDVKFGLNLTGRNFMRVQRGSVPVSQVNKELVSSRPLLCQEIMCLTDG